MRFERFFLVAFAAFPTVRSAPVLAHHSIAPFDVDQTVSLDATVTRFEWANPHVYIQLETRDDAGTLIRWMIEAGPPNLMARAGWSAESLSVGESVTATVHPMRTGTRGVALGNSITKQDGIVLPIRETALPTELSTPDGSTLVAADEIFGRWIAVWDVELAGRFLQPASGWSVTDAGRSAIEAYDVSDSPSKECNFEKPPFAMIWPSVRDIVSDGNLVRIRFELLPDRVIHLDATSREGAQYSPDGHSIGHFDGEALVVDTDHFEAHRRGLGQGLPSSREKRLVERFELSADGKEIIYSFRVEDPIYLVDPMSGTIRFQHRPDLTLESVPCDPEIAGRYVDYE